MKKKILSLLLIILICTTLIGCGVEAIKPIKSLSLGYDEKTKTSGAFILGSGVFKSDDTITTKYYLYVFGEEGYGLKEYDSKDVEIVETNDMDPCVKIKQRIYIGDIVEETYVLYVPEGTIQETYDASIENLKENVK